MRNTTREQIANTYTEMYMEADYRARPITDERKMIGEEAAAYAEHWNAEEDSGTFHIGVCDFETRPATIKAIEAARLLCAVNEVTALKLLKSAVADLEARVPTA